MSNSVEKQIVGYKKNHSISDIGQKCDKEIL